MKKPHKHQDAIIKCIGRIFTYYGQQFETTRKPKWFAGTATVFNVRGGKAYAITCAHNVVQRNIFNKSQRKCQRIIFRRQSKSNKIQDYEAKVLKIHNYKFRTGDESDLALLVFDDIDQDNNYFNQ